MQQLIPLLGYLPSLRSNGTQNPFVIDKYSLMKICVTGAFFFFPL